MTAAHPSTAAQLSPAHATFRPSGEACVVTGGVLDEMTKDERDWFVARVEALANGYGLAMVKVERLPSAPPNSAPARPGIAVGHGAATTSLSYTPAAVTA